VLKRVDRVECMCVFASVYIGIVFRKKKLKSWHFQAHDIAVLATPSIHNKCHGFNSN
jgi:hypothetical protein